MKSRLKEIMASVFESTADSINDDSSSDTIDNWDSLTHMNLIVALEEEFEIEFLDEEIADLLNYPALKASIQQKQN